MRLLNTVFAGLLLAIIVMFSFTSEATAAQTKQQPKQPSMTTVTTTKTAKHAGKHKKCSCVCHKGNSAGKHWRRHKKTPKVAAIPPASVQPKTVEPVVPKQPLAVEANYPNITLNTEMEGSSAPTALSLAGGGEISEAGEFLSINSGSLQAWFKGTSLNVYSPDGRGGRVVISDKKGNTLSVVKVTAPPAAPTVQKQQLTAIAANTAAANNLLFKFAMIVSVLLLIIAGFMLVALIQNRATIVRLNNANSALYTIEGDVVRISRSVGSINHEMQRNTEVDPDNGN